MFPWGFDHPPLLICQELINLWLTIYHRSDLTDVMWSQSVTSLNNGPVQIWETMLAPCLLCFMSSMSQLFSGLNHVPVSLGLCPIFQRALGNSPGSYISLPSEAGFCSVSGDIANAFHNVTCRWPIQPYRTLETTGIAFILCQRSAWKPPGFNRANLMWRSTETVSVWWQFCQVCGWRGSMVYDYRAIAPGCGDVY